MLVKEVTQQYYACVMPWVHFPVPHKKKKNLKSVVDFFMIL